MRIDHLALYVQNLEAAKEFFILYFGAKANEGYENPNTGLCTYFLTFSDGARLEIMTRPSLQETDKMALHTGYTHLAFSVGGKEAVDHLTARLQADGYQVASGPRTTGDGYYESCVFGPENNMIEITE